MSCFGHPCFPIIRKSATIGLYKTDVGTDIYSAIQYLKQGHEWWGWLTLFFSICPMLFAAIILFRIASLSRKWRRAFLSIICFPLAPVGALYWDLIVAISNRRKVDYNVIEWRKITDNITLDNDNSSNSRSDRNIINGDDINRTTNCDIFRKIANNISLDDDNSSNSSSDRNIINGDDINRTTNCDIISNDVNDISNTNDNIGSNDNNDSNLSNDGKDDSTTNDNIGSNDNNDSNLSNDGNDISNTNDNIGSNANNDSNIINGDDINRTTNDNIGSNANNDSNISIDGDNNSNSSTDSNIISGDDINRATNYGIISNDVTDNSTTNDNVFPIIIPEDNIGSNTNNDSNLTIDGDNSSNSSIDSTPDHIRATAMVKFAIDGDNSSNSSIDSTPDHIRATAMVKFAESSTESLPQAAIAMHIIFQTLERHGWDGVENFQWITLTVSLVTLAFSLATNDYLDGKLPARGKFLIFIFSLPAITCRLMVGCTYSAIHPAYWFIPVGTELAIWIILVIIRKYSGHNLFLRKSVMAVTSSVYVWYAIGGFFIALPIAITITSLVLNIVMFPIQIYFLM